MLNKQLEVKADVFLLKRVTYKQCEEHVMSDKGADVNVCVTLRALRTDLKQHPGAIISKPL